MTNSATEGAMSVTEGHDCNINTSTSATEWWLKRANLRDKECQSPTSVFYTNNHYTITTRNKAP
ncbi:hypothetical protein E2C01_079144 [Portunus trituberculatus]|uniref:Uncharacterized protein n=1 Tax=Portunus trituberculatus TaxID=210409 RepID=A0A5B7IRZ0_PORTR|nr:hypothetical protein [Portunus trituberculatus]